MHDIILIIESSRLYNLQMATDEYKPAFYTQYQHETDEQYTWRMMAEKNLCILPDRLIRIMELKIGDFFALTDEPEIFWVAIDPPELINNKYQCQVMRYEEIKKQKVNGELIC